MRRCDGCVVRGSAVFRGMTLVLLQLKNALGEVGRNVWIPAHLLQPRRCKHVRDGKERLDAGHSFTTLTLQARSR
jgi:hypothetical protein